ncbi:hypothetical protein EBE87_11995 [Pseudoroseomonas wenyumeiae]|uniref:Uncharacterized protein n=1 Tax=Teichococcus wenyumeiae TaxID=2478470 RepID=A0A3A9JC01_9PROT|nr:hypothetical protein [Pseudoroseomonas wenyumeiae]RKK01126.1 hypothetical protein D6Z83_26665 [Pseudoroseomonas wenyumeiae]RMI24855.1 hypothetical protein EBE87_11995 [Pseudoroseomonas wenyumeiae]
MLRRRTRPIFRQPPRRLPELRHLVLALLLVLTLPARAEAPALARSDGSVLVSLFLPAGEAATHEQIAETLLREGVVDQLPTAGLGIESWYAMPGFGQFVTLRLPPTALNSAARKPGPGLQHVAQK